MLRVSLRYFTLLTLLLYLGIAAQAAIIRVPQDQPTIKAAFDAAAAGDTVELADGTYYSGDNFGWLTIPKAVSLRSASDNPAACIVKQTILQLELYSSSSPYNVTISGITFKEYSGVSIGGRGGKATFSNCVFDDTDFNRSGIGVTDDSGTLIVTHCTFKNYDDSIDVTGKHPISASVQTLSVSDCTFTNNICSGSLVTIFGFTLDDYNMPYTASFTRCTFENNTGLSGTAGLSIRGSYDVKITDCRFANNSGHWGGAIYWNTPEWTNTGSFSVHNSTFINNRAEQGAALNLEGGTRSATIANSVFVNNTADEVGGAIRSASTNLTVINSSFVNNQSPLGGDIYHLYDGYSTPGSGLALSNSILWGNTTTSTGSRIAQSDQAGPVVLQNNLIEGYPGLTGTPDASGNFSADPLFVRNPLTSGPNDEGDLRLLPASPAINTGSNALLIPDTHDLDNDGDTSELLPIDLGLNPRVNNNTVDLGAFEYQNQAPVANSQNVATNQDTPLGIALTASDSDGESLTYTVGSNPSHGSLSGTAPNLTYTPNAGYVGTDSFTFTVTDPYGMVSNTATVSITVKDKTAPVITLNGANPMSINQGTTFTDPGATAVDNVDGTVPVTVSGSVNTNAPGSYTLTYSAKDTAGNIATKTRTVNVIAVATPKVTIKLSGIAQLLGIVGVVVTIKNEGTETVNNVKLTSASLIGVNALLAVPNNGFSLKPGKSQDVAIVFFPLFKGQKGTLNVNGSYTGGTFSLSQTVTIP